MSNEPPPGDFGATTLDREAMSFEDIEALAQAQDAPAPEREVVGPKWAGTLPAAPVELGASPAAPVVVPPAAAPPRPAPVEVAPAAAPVDPMDLAATTLHQQVHAVPISEEPPVDQLTEDLQVAEAGRAAGLRAGSAASAKGDLHLKVGLAVLVLVIALLVVGLCAGLGTTLIEESQSAAEIEE